MPSAWRHPPSALLPLLICTAVLAIEALLFSIWLDTGSLPAESFVRRFGPTAVRSAVLFSIVVAGLGYRVFRRLPLRPSFAWAGAHVSLLCAFAVISQRMFGGSDDAAWFVPAWLLTGLGAIVCVPVACSGAAAWGEVLWELRATLAVTAPAAVIAVAGARLAWRLWDIAGGVTFALVELLLRPLVPGLKFEFATRTIESSAFAVQVAPECSGYEGIGLVLLFGAAWLWVNRAEYRFPRALLLLPAGAVAIFLLNSGRIAALFLIGHLGASGIAAGGFHSQAGWMVFLAVSVAMAAWSRRMAWFCTAGAGGAVVATVGVPDRDHSPEPTTAALAPFLAITLASILTGAVSAGFDWLYPVRFIAACAALWFWRDAYRELNWSVSWRAAVSGAVVIAVWIAQEAWVSPVPKPPAVWPPVWWIAIRAIAASTTVPIAEELAFRHFLQRRFVSAEFAQLDPRRVPLWTVGAAAMLFGVLHGPRWPAGVLAGVVFGLEYRRRGSIGDAALSHGVANALLAAYVLTTGNWQLW